jgi:hypothetical protein
VPLQVDTTQPNIVVEEPQYWFPPVGLDLTHRLSRLDTKSAADIKNLMLDDGVLRSRLGLAFLNSEVDTPPAPTSVFDTLQGTPATLNAHAPTNPGASGWTAWEYNEASAAFVIWPTFGGVIHDYYANPGTHDPKNVARTNVAFAQTTLKLSADVYRLSVVPIPQATEGFDICARVPNTTIGSFTSRNYIYGHMRTNGVLNKAYLSIVFVNSSGVESTISAPEVEISWPQSTGRQLIFEIASGVATWSDADFVTGASPTVRATATVPSAVITSANDRVGLKVYTTASWGFTGYNYRITAA